MALAFSPILNIQKGLNLYTRLQFSLLFLFGNASISVIDGDGSESAQVHHHYLSDFSSPEAIVVDHLVDVSKTEQDRIDCEHNLMLDHAREKEHHDVRYYHKDHTCKSPYGYL